MVYGVNCYAYRGSLRFGVNYFPESHDNLGGFRKRKIGTIIWSCGNGIAISMLDKPFTFIALYPLFFHQYVYFLI